MANDIYRFSKYLNLCFKRIHFKERPSLAPLFSRLFIYVLEDLRSPCLIDEVLTAEPTSMFP